ncbi:MAG: cytochrome c [Gemmatimonadetes bacterium]|nr:cytochrome c [Gemmatimonadota bacterium]
MPGEWRRKRSAAAAAVLAACVLSLGGCTRMEDAMALVPFLNFMREAPSFDPYEAPRPAPANSVPLESPAGTWEPTIPTPVTEAALQEFAASVTSPTTMDEAVLARGEHIFLTYCSVCHGPQGEGNGPVVGPGKFPMGPDLRIPNTVGRSDGYIYAVVKAGRGLMPSYRRIPPADRWAVVSYVRQLQGQGGVAPAPGTVSAPASVPAAGADTAPAMVADTASTGEQE